jgi:NitT/TauT family transport system permease protein
MNRILPVLTVLAAIVVIWYVAAVGLNMNWARQQLEREGVTESPSPP